MSEEAMKRYDDDARILIKKLAENEIKLKHGELNPVGVQILIEHANNILQTESVTDAIAKLI